MNIVQSLYVRWAIRRDPIRYARSIGVIVGARCRLLGIVPGTFGSEPYLVSIGEHVTITSGVRFITHDGGVWVFRDEYPDLDVIAPIRILDNVFVGMNTIIMPGVTIGPNAVIGAGSVVTRDVPENAVAAGAPAKPIRSLTEYRTRALQGSVNVRSLSEQAKRRTLLEKFGSTS